MDSVFLVALQSSLVLGLIHGVNPCGHSWLVLAPFVYGEKNGKRVSLLTFAFIAGTTVACLFIGLTLGVVSMALPPQVKSIVDLATLGILVLLGLILLIKPGLLHSHDHDHDHDHDHGHHHHGHEHHHHHEASGASCHLHGKKSKLGKSTAWGLFGIGFVNMIVPCPTLAIMYSYALDSASALKSTLVFAVYAVGTAIALVVVIYAIYKVTTALRTLNKPWIEPLVMRTAGVMTIGFAVYSYMADLSAAAV